MAFISDLSDSTHIMRKYAVSNTNTRESALIWIALVSKNPGIHVSKISVEDFLSFHDGTISRNLKQIDDIGQFVSLYKNSPIENVSLSGEHNEHRFFLSLNLNCGIILLSSRKSENVDYQALEQLLGLV